MVDLKVETHGGVSGANKRFLGVSKAKNRWRARVRHPILKADVQVGTYGTPEEAAVAVQKKKAEFAEMLKSAEAADSLSMGTCKDYFKEKKLPNGVLWDKGRYRVRIWHPELKKMVSGGSYKTCEEAADAADRKREEFPKMYEGIKLPNNDEVFQKPQSLVACKSGYSEEQTCDVRVPPGIRRVKTGKWAARIKKPDSKGRLWLGTYSTLEEAIISLNKKKAEFDAQLKKPEFDWVECKPGFEAKETPMKFKYDCPTPISVFDPENLNNAPAGSDKSCDLDFDRAMSLGVINEYGQLLGKYSELDTQMGI